MRRVGLDPRKQADRIARRSKREFGGKHHHIHIGHQMREVDQHVARQIDHRHFKRLTEFFLKLHECGAIGHQRRIDRCLCRKDRQVIIGADHCAFDEQTIDAAGVFDRIGKPAAGFKIKAQRPGAKVHVKIEQRSGHLVVGREQPCQRGCQHRRAHSAARSNHGG